MQRTKLLGLAAAALFASLAFGQAPAIAVEQSDGIHIMKNCGTYATNQSVTRAEVIARAQSWIDEGVGYNQDGCYDNRFGDYRMDCSGHTSMAWGLTHSRTTWTLPEVSTEIAIDALKPGDVLNDIQNHVSMFGGWTDGSRTAAIMLNHGGPGKAHRTVYSRSTMQTFKAFRYKNIIESDVNQPTVLSTASGALALYRVSPVDGNVYGTSQPALGQKFSPWTALTSGGGFIGKAAAVQFASGAIGVYARTVDGRIMATAQSTPGGAFGPWATIGGSGGVASDPTVLLTPSNTVVVYVTNTSGGVSGATQLSPGATISPWERLNGANLVGKPAAVQFPNGAIGLYVRTGDGRVEASGQTVKGGTFSSWVTIGGSRGVAGDPTAVLTKSNTVAVYVTNNGGGVSGAGQAAPGATIGNWQQLGGAQLVGRPDAVVFDNGTIGLYARTADGRIEASGQSAPGGGFGTWTTIGGSSGVASDADAILTKNGTVAVYVTNATNGVSGTAQSAPGGTLPSWQQI